MFATKSTRPTHSSYRNRLSQIFSWPSSRTVGILERASISVSRLSTSPNASESSFSPILSQTSTPPDDQPVVFPGVSTPSSSPVPHTPTSPLSVQMDANAPLVNEAIPPTTNELDAKEKARLIKKARKLSRVFGDDVLNLSQSVPQVPVVTSQQHSRPGSAESHASAELKKNLVAGSKSLPQIHESSQAPTEHDPDPLQLPHVPEDPAKGSLSSDSPLSLTTPPTSFVNDLSNIATHVTVSSAEQSAPTSSSGAQLPSRRRKSAEHTRMTTQEKQVKRRSRSLSARPVSRIEEEGNLDSVDPVMLEQERVRAVKRARKMTKLFGPEFSAELAENRVASQAQHGLRSASLSQLALTPDLPTLATPMLTRERTRSAASLPESLREIDVNKDKDSTRIPGSDTDEDPRSFKERRRRAAKLADFFGVQYQDLAASLEVKELPPVRIELGRRAWGFPSITRNEATEEDMDMQDVRERLRNLRA